MTQEASKIIEAIKTSDKLELNAEETGVGRKGNPPVPELAKGGKRKEVSEEETKAEMEYLKEADLNDPVVMELVGPEEAKNTWRQVEGAYKIKFLDRKVLYSRYDKGQGHIIISSYKQDPSKIAEEVKLDLEGEVFTIKKLEGDGLEKFWAEHGNHYNLCTNKKLSLSSIAY